jgi:hypothetical protein
MTRKIATKAPVPPKLDEDSAERKRVLNVLAQRRYSTLFFSLVEYAVEYALTRRHREKEEGASTSS